MEKITLTTKDLVSIPHASKELGVHFTTVYRWLKKGLFHPITIGEQDFITRTDLETLKKGRETKQ